MLNKQEDMFNVLNKDFAVGDLVYTTALRTTIDQVDREIGLNLLGYHEAVYIGLLRMRVLDTRIRHNLDTNLNILVYSDEH